MPAITGNVNVITIPAITANVNVITIPAITGNINVISTANVNVLSIPAFTGNVNVINTINGNVNVITMPALTGNVNVITIPSIIGNVAVTGNVYLNNNSATVTVSNPLPVVATISGNVTTTVVGGQQDAFGRLRVSEEFTLGDYKHTYGIDPNFRDNTSYGGNVVHIAYQSAARLSSNTHANSYAIHQTKMYHNYMPGKSQLIKTTVNFYEHTANVTKRTGYFDDRNGIYFEQDGNGVLSFVIRTDTSGTPSDARRITQSQWNQNTCNTTIIGTSTDGTNYGKAGTWDLDISKTQIAFIDFQWLGVGRVRCGFVHNGQTIIAHEFYNSNFLPTVYMSNPNLPIRCEIRNTGSSAGAYFDQICSSVVSEGGYVESGIDFSIDSGQTGQSITVGNGEYPVLAYRLKNSFRGYPNRVVVRSKNINIYAENYPCYWVVRKISGLANITLSNPSWISANPDSAVEYTANATAFVGGDRLDGGIVGTTSPGGSAKGTGVAPVNQPSDAKKNFIAQNNDSSDSEIYLITAKAIGGTVSVWADVQWREIY